MDRHFLLILGNLLPFCLWMLVFLINCQTEVGFFIFSLPWAQFLATVFAGIANVVHCSNLKEFNLYSALLLLSAVGGSHLAGVLHYRFISNDWATPVVSLLYTLIFAVTVAVFIIVGNIVVYRKRRGEERVDEKMGG